MTFIAYIVGDLNTKNIWDKAPDWWLVLMQQNTFFKTHTGTVTSAVVSVIYLLCTLVVEILTLQTWYF